MPDTPDMQWTARADWVAAIATGPVAAARAAIAKATAL